MMKKTLIASAILMGLSTYGMGPAAAANTVNVVSGAGAGAEAYLDVYSVGTGAIQLQTGKGAGTMGEIVIALDVWRLAVLKNPSLHVPVCLFGGGMGWDRASVQWPSPATFQVGAVGQTQVYLTWATNQSAPLADNSEYWIEFRCWQ
jgi:hypothetical protein